MDILRLILFAALLRFYVAAASPAAPPWNHYAHGGHSCTSTVRPARERREPAAAPAQGRQAAGSADRSAAGRRRTRRGGRRRARGRRAGRRHQQRGPSTVSGGGGYGGLCVVSLNVQSVKPKILSLRHDLNHFNCDICVLSETWLKPETHSRYVHFPGYDFTRADRPDGRGYGGSLC